MSKDYCFSNIPHHVQALLLAHLLYLFSFLLSHPLYFAYLLFLFTRLVQFLYFVSPLLMSTSLLILLSLLTISPHLKKPTRYSFFANIWQKVVSALQVRLDDNADLNLYEPLLSTASELEACLWVDALNYNGRDDPVTVEGALGETLIVGEIQEFMSHGSSIGMVSQEPAFSVGENCSRVYQKNDGMDTKECQRLNSSLEEPQGPKYNLGEESVEVPQQHDEFGEFHHNELNIWMGLGSIGHKRGTRDSLPKGVNHSAGENAMEIPQQNDELGTYEHQEFKTSLVCKTGSIVSRGLAYKAEENPVQVMDGSDKENHDVIALNAGGFGSMRKEKEWKRTLACKLYEERQSVDGTEGMDLLWEVYEVNSGKGKAKNKKEKVKKEDIEHDEEEEEEEEDSQLCCLQALRFSTGKMNLGMRRLNSMRISKAFKGMGLFVRKERKVF